jgi:hypothetical protein
MNLQKKFLKNYEIRFMEVVWSNKIDEILRVGHQLTEIGLRNWALSKPQAIIAIQKFSKYRIPVLGGDVCEMLEGIIKPNCDSWHCDQYPDEKKDDYINRSISTARDYIESYPSQQSDKIFFVLVPGV